MTERLNVLDLSRPLTVYDSSINSPDVQILQKAFRSFADPTCRILVHKLIPKFTLVYGNSISHPSLHHAIILYCVGKFPEFSDSRTITEQSQRARQALDRRLKRRDLLDEGDLFAAFFIALFNNSVDHEDFKQVYEFLGLARYLFYAAALSVAKPTFYTFWRLLVWDILSDSGVSIHNAVPELDFFGPRDYQEWESALNVDSEHRNTLLDLSPSYFQTLETFYIMDQTRRANNSDMVDVSVRSWIIDIETQLKTADEQSWYQAFDQWLGEGWRNSLTYPRPEGIFWHLLHYNFCHPLLNALSLA